LMIAFELRSYGEGRAQLRHEYGVSGQAQGQFELPDQTRLRNTAEP
jgi:hypothetical protein